MPDVPHGFDLQSLLSVSNDRVLVQHLNGHINIVPSPLVTNHISSCTCIYMYKVIFKLICHVYIYIQVRLGPTAGLVLILFSSHTIHCKEKIHNSNIIFDSSHHQGKLQSKQYWHCVSFPCNINGWRISNVSTYYSCLLYTSPSPRDATLSRMPSSA